MDFVSPIIGPIVQSLLVPVKKHLGFFISSTKYVKKMGDKMKQLNDIAQEVQDKRQLAVGNTEVVPARVEPWLEDVKSLNERSNLIGVIGCFHVAKRYKVGKQSYSILEEIKDLENRESKIEFTHALKPLAEVGSTCTGPSTSAPVSMATQNNFESRDLIFKNALQALQSNKESQKMIALCGMGGVGKTTMMEQLKKVVEDSKVFDLVIKVVIGENNEPTSLQKAIAEYIGKKLDETTINARADRLRKIFEVKSQQGQKKILVIMDDLWKEVDLTDVGLSPLPVGFKLLFTSRFEKVCTQMGVEIDSIFRIGVLSDNEAKTLFSRIVGPCHSDDEDELQRIGEDIVRKCSGLPIAIVTIAKSLRGNKKEAWKEALSNLEHHDLDHIVHKIFEMSYKKLEREDDKAIFLLSGLFPDDFNIPIEDLMMYGWGLKLFAKVNTLTEARIRASVCVENLIRANLLTESDINGCVKMHDLVRAFVLSNFSEVKQASIVNHDNMSSKRLIIDSCERILLNCKGMSGFPLDFNCPNLSLLILMGGYEFFKLPEDMHKRMEKLKVVSYENMGIPRLPITFNHSTTLRTLCLRSCSLTNDISFLGSFCNLETLTLSDCNIRRLPSAIGKLKKLKLLDVTGCVDLYIDHGVFQNLDGLEELYMRASKGRFVRFAQANCDELEKLSHLLSTLELEFFDNELLPKNMFFKNLERFRISIGCELKIYENYSFRNTLNLVAECTELNECNIGDLFRKTEELRLQVKNMIHLEDVSLHHTFSQLRCLHISNCAELIYLFTVNMANDLKKLERLTISKCHMLKEVISENSGIGVVRLKKLNFMCLEDLPKMVCLSNNVVELPEMVEMRLVGLPNFTNIYPDSNGNVSEIQPLFNKEGVIPKLEKLDISMMKNLKQIWPCRISTSEKNDVFMLRQFRVRECDSLINLFPSNPLPILNNLEEIVVERCNSVEVLFNIDFESVYGKGKQSSSRLRRIEVNKLGKLKELRRVRGTKNSDILIDSFKGVKSIEIRDCERFTNIFTPTTINFDLGALTSYISIHTTTSSFFDHWRARTSYISSYDSADSEESDRKDKMIETDQEINLTYPSYLLHKCHHLQRLELTCDKRVKEVVFDMDGSRQLATTQPPLLLPYLQSINLDTLTEMSHVWKCNNWNKFLHHQPPPLQFPFQNLTDITLWHCDKIKYLFSPLMAKYLSNLKRVNITGCDGIEEVVSRTDNEENTSTSSHQNTALLFPYFDTLNLHGLDCLKRIGGEENIWSMRDKISSNTSIHHQHFQSGQVIGGCWSLCQYPRNIFISGCYALSSLIPCYAVGQMKRLQELEIVNCKMTEVFESELTNSSIDTTDDNNVEKAGGVVSTSLTLKNFTTHHVVVPQLSNLKIISIYQCDFLPHLFTFSTLTTLNHLKELKVKSCKTIQVIVKEEIETSSEVVVVFLRLETLKLDRLPELKGFFLGKNEFRWPSLVNVMINDCPQWVGTLEAPKIKYVRTSFGKYDIGSAGFNFQTTFPTSSSSSEPAYNISEEMPFTFHDLIEINMEGAYGHFGTTVIPSHALLQVQKLQQITIGSNSWIREVFDVVALVLELRGTDNKSQTTTVVKIPNLTQVKLWSLHLLDYLWMPNQWMVLEFPNLTTVDIYHCHSLRHVFTCSMVGSLVQLQHLKVSDCKIIAVIVREEKEENCDDKVNEIMLPRLNSLALDGLQRLKGFCLGKEAFSLPALDALQIKDCPEIKVFTKGHVSTPELKEIDTSFGMCDVRTDLNSFIESKQEEVRTNIIT